MSAGQPAPPPARTRPAFRRAIDGTLAALGWGYVVIGGITLYDIVARNVFAAPTTWVLEISVLICGLLFLAGCVAAALSGVYIRMEVSTGILGRLPAWLTAGAGAACGLIFAGAILWGAWRPASAALRVGERSGSILNSYAPTILKVAIPVMGAALILVILAQLLGGLRKPR